MRFAAALLTAACATAWQSPAPPPAIVRGDVIEWDAARGAGELSIRTASHQVFRFSFDDRTYFERERQRITADNLARGDLVEIVSDALSGAALRYARTVHVLEVKPALRRRASAASVPAGSASRAWRSSLDRILPPGNLTFSGIVARINGGRMVLRTRRDGAQTILLREDTRFLENGMEVAASALAPNLRVFVRASKNFENNIEAHQVIWGDILDPASGR